MKIERFIIVLLICLSGFGVMEAKALAPPAANSDGETMSAQAAADRNGELPQLRPTRNSDVEMLEAQTTRMYYDESDDCVVIAMDNIGDGHAHVIIRVWAPDLPVLQRPIDVVRGNTSVLIGDVFSTLVERSTGETISINAPGDAQNEPNTAMARQRFTTKAVQTLHGDFGPIFEPDLSEVPPVVSTDAAAGSECATGGPGTTDNTCGNTCAGPRSWPQKVDPTEWRHSCKVTCYEGYYPCCNCESSGASCTCAVDPFKAKACLIPLKM